MATTTLRVKGMTCDGCVRSVTRALTAVEGVTNVDVSLEKGEAVVTHADSTPVTALRSAVEDAGYDVE
ncbi:heavy-metal-associated domain-containing protein [Alicyclobacillus sendaiensis]|uniref:Heavy metal-associated domain-containing protein n=1 Tax=Alicyclobacillus sendaiensis PA2 TaxID=3029425 RepID=A0ABT6XV26_ALISE|nr:heavy metal-associated domain-containing protein [Alicyclobacillus sendaiensis]MDI9258935.1 heavy metal-associated domain-containing protein [Alicyclobacillus sendaiensis PA2]